LVLIGSVEEVVDIVHFLGAAEELVLGIGAGGALAGRRGASHSSSRSGRHLWSISLVHSARAEKYGPI